MFFYCSEPQTFLCNEPNVLILDENNRLFFWHPNKEKKINFNLPIGKYSTNNTIKKNPFFEPYENFDTYHFDINPKEFEVITGTNKHKATINSDRKKILIDETMANHVYKPCTTFILAHEIGHIIFGGSLFDKNGKLIFDAEKACDDFSRNWMLANGYNPTQVEAAVKLLISNNERKDCIHKNTIQKKYRR